jgi:hypothetical protein
MEPLTDDIPVTDLGLSPVQQEILDKGGNPEEFKLSTGTVIQFKQPDGMASWTIAELMGNQSMNPVLSIFYRVTFCLASIDGVPVKTPKTELEVKALAARLAKNNSWEEAVINFYRWSGLTDDGKEPEEEPNNPVKK